MRLTRRLQWTAGFTVRSKFDAVAPPPLNRGVRPHYPDMKLKAIATLIFRLIGALLVFGGFGNTVATVIAVRTGEAIFDGIFMLLVGFCFIYFSKKLAQLFCKGIDDDVA